MKLPRGPKVAKVKALPPTHAELLVLIMRMVELLRGRLPPRFASLESWVGWGLTSKDPKVRAEAQATFDMLRAIDRSKHHG